MNHFQTSDGLRLAYQDEGAGKPVLCLAGLTRNHRDFNDMAPHLPDGIRLIRIDYRGRGASDFDDNHLNYAIPVEARDALELLDHLGVDKTAIIGTSRGGLIAMVLAATVKDRLSGVLLNDIGPEIAQGGLDRIMDYLGIQPEFASYDEAAKGLSANLADSFPGVSTAKWCEAATRWWNETPDGLRINYDPRLRDAIVAMSAEPAADAWPLFEALDGLPTALLRGQNSDLLTASDGPENVRTPPRHALCRGPGPGACSVSG